ncbi:nucleoside kinase [Lachnoclostridium sp. Marseille-P6806]|uniref:nucleoside kinase n=1 Tax=Lachnoclostridium sp. Marseille-P6806 TaxID=2364793 RepID=UPI0010305004|nr:nucleoside kinase [Lachnoclostridium sp. Marseille-P6806]
MPALMIDGFTRSYERGTSYEAIAGEYQEAYQNTIALVFVNGKMRELTKRADRDGVLSFITTRDPIGYKTFCRTAQMMLVKAVWDLCGPAVHVKIEFSVGNGYFCSLRGLEKEADEAFAAAVEERMRALRDSRLPISKKTYPIDDAIALFDRQGMQDKVKLFHFRRGSTVNVYNMDGYCDYFYGYMLPNTGFVRRFAVQSYRGGLMLVLPTQQNPDVLELFADQRNLFESLMLSTEWGELVNISTVGDLNEQICRGNISDMILVQEALQERRIGDIAETIYGREDVRFVLIAGPSSSGKTTFAHRLSIQMRSFGLAPHIISLDDYFVNREKTPVDIDGNYNFECLEAIDLELFNADMMDLLEGKEVELPSFNFKTGRREYKGNRLKLGDEDILVIEGIHCLNPKTTALLPDESKFRIYTSALTTLNIDEHNRIPTTDARLLRRMVRDARTRSRDARQTIGGWQSVREGEEQYIFPYQENADAIFNSVLIYELSVLKQFAEPLLFNVRQGEPEYYEAKRLLKFLDYFVGVDTAAVPTNSLCREFVGGGCFPV